MTNLIKQGYIGNPAQLVTVRRVTISEGRIKAFPTTLSDCQTKDGKILVYADDPIGQTFFGCAGVCEIPDMEDKMLRLSRGGFKLHTSVGVGHRKDILKEAFTAYLHYDWVDIDKD